MKGLDLPEWLVLATCVCTFAIVLTVRLQRKDVRIRELQLHGLDILHMLRQLIARIQQHRGLTNGLLNGSSDLRQRVDTLQRDINRTITELDSQLQLSDLERWQTSTEHWQRLRTAYATLGSHNNLLQHNCLIMTLLYLVEDVAEVCALSQSRNDTESSIDFLWKRLLPLAETIGQARALGTGIAASGVCTSVNRIRMQFLLGKLRETTEHAENNHALPLSRAVVNQLRQFERLIQQKLMESDAPDMAPDQFFQQATEVLDTVLMEFDAGVKQARQDMSSKGRIEQARMSASGSGATA